MSTKFNLSNYLESLITPELEIETRAYVLLGSYMVQIENALDEQGITKKELAERVGVTPIYISKLFGAEKLTNFKMLARIEKALNLDFVEHNFHLNQQQENIKN